MSNGYSGEKLIDLAESIIKVDNADLKLDLLAEIVRGGSIMALTPEQKSILDDWLDSKDIKNQCSACGHPGFDRKEWEIVYLPKTCHVTDPKEQHKAIISMTCTKCGHIKFFSAEAIGFNMIL